MLVSICVQLAGRELATALLSWDPATLIQTSLVFIDILWDIAGILKVYYKRTKTRILSITIFFIFILLASAPGVLHYVEQTTQNGVV